MSHPMVFDDNVEELLHNHNLILHHEILFGHCMG